MSTIEYIKNFLKDRNVASVTPSSTFVVRRILRKMHFDDETVIVEYGPGAGVFSKRIIERMGSTDRLVLIERNSDFVASLQELAADPRVTLVNGDAQNVRQILDEQGIDQADYVISGIPFSFLDEDVKRQLVVDTYEVLREGGKFLVYQHYNHMEESLKRHFDQVNTEREIRNIPPLCIWEAIHEA